MFFRNKPAPVAWIAAFLGNPGARYEKTRHNAGFMTADTISANAGIKINRMKFNSLTATAAIGGQSILLMKPQTYMNLSGGAVSQAMRFYKVPLNNIIVVSDDVSLPAGKLRIRKQGSSGGHNGLKDIISKCGGDGFPRIRIGVGAPPHADYEMMNWVLSVPADDDGKLINEAITGAVKALESILEHGVDHAMGEYN